MYVVPYLQPVDHNVDSVLDLFIEIGNLAAVVDNSVDLDPYVALLADALENGLMLALSRTHDRRYNEQLSPLGKLHDSVDYLIDALFFDRLAAFGTMRMTYPRVKQPEIIAYLGHSADSRARVVGGALLIDGNSGRKPFDMIDVRLVHLPQELTGVRGKRLHVAALALCIDRIESERRLAGARNAGKHYQFISRQLERNVF